MTDLDRIRQWIKEKSDIEGKTTPGKWEVHKEDLDAGVIFWEISNGGVQVATTSEISNMEKCIPDAHFIADSRTTVPQALDALNMAVECIQAYVDDYPGCHLYAKETLTKIRERLELKEGE